MRGIFPKIYFGILLSLLLIISIVIIGYGYWNNHRLNQYLSSNTAGTIQLIIDGLNRHQGEKQQEWLALTRRVTALHIDIVAEHQDELDDAQAWQNFKALFQTQSTVARKPQLTIWRKLQGDDQRWVRIELFEDSVNESFFRGSKILILNYLGLYTKELRKLQFKELQKLYGFAIQWLKEDQLNVNYIQMRALRRGGSVVEFAKLTDGATGLKMISPIGNSGEFLKLGELPLFEKYPLLVMLLLGTLSLVLLTFISFVLIRPVEVRLTRMTKEVELITKHGSKQLLTVDGNDALTALSTKINQMSAHISRLLNAQKELNSAVSHELKTPLAKLTFHRELAMQKLQNIDTQNDAKDKIYKHLDHMQGNIDELNLLVEEILFYASLDNVIPQLNTTKLALDPLIESVFLSHKQLNTELDYRLNGQPGCQLVADKHHLKRALENLVGNAQRYALSQIQVNVMTEAQYLYICVEDDGPGIAETEWAHVFEPFYSVEGSTISGGSGLGLSIVSKIAHWHSGSVSIGKSELGGAKFQLVLPMDVQI